jgi:hypothetical protein
VKEGRIELIRGHEFREWQRLNYGAIGGRVECMKERRHELRGANYRSRSVRE